MTGLADVANEVKKTDLGGSGQLGQNNRFGSIGQSGENDGFGGRG